MDGLGSDTCKDCKYKLHRYVSNLNSDYSSHSSLLSLNGIVAISFSLFSKPNLG